MPALHHSNKLVVLLVLCSMTEDRYEIALKTVNSLRNIGDVASCELVIIENGSKFKCPNESLPPNSTYIFMEKNLGYWGILYWALFSRFSPLSNLNTEYIYIIESDHIHYDLARLNIAISVLDKYKDVASARVQEFSVRFRALYAKEYKFLPFRKRRSLVSLRNAVTKDKVKFIKLPEESGAYLANWHARLPSVFRLSSLVRTFDILSSLEKFSEFDFFQIMHKESQRVIVLNRGIYFPASSAANSKQVLSGSWMKNYQGENYGYQATRHSELSPRLLTEIPSQIERHYLRK